MWLRPGPLRLQLMPWSVAGWPIVAEPAFYLVAVPAVLLMGLAKSGFGAGFGALATPLMAMAIPVPQAAAIMLPLLLVMDAFGLAALWREADRELLPTERLVRQMRASIAELRPDWVLVPSPGELHPDHRAVCLAACQAFRASFSPGHPARLGFYEVGQPLSPNVLVDITAVLDAKRAAMACFVSQLAQQRYDEQVLALNRFRAYTLGALVSHAEALQLLSADDLVDGLPGWLEQTRQTMLRRLGLR